MWNFTPCRRVVVYKYDNDKVYILEEGGVIKLGKAGKILWEMSDGKHCVKDIVNRLALMYNEEDKVKVYKKTIDLMEQLKSKKLIIMNWNPLYKFELEGGDY